MRSPVEAHVPAPVSAAHGSSASIPKGFPPFGVTSTASSSVSRVASPRGGAVVDEVVVLERLEVTAGAVDEVEPADPDGASSPQAPSQTVARTATNRMVHASFDRWVTEPVTAPRSRRGRC